MIGLIATTNNKKKISLKIFLVAFLACASVVTWIGISTLFAEEDDPADNMENTELSFQNTAQKKHAKNVAIKAALQDQDVIAAIEKAKESGELDDFKAARAQFKETVADITQRISNLRAEGKGWGVIAKDLGVHPRYLGLGHYKHKAKYSAHYQTQHRIKSENQAVYAGSHKAQSMKGHGSQKFNGHNKDQDLALSHGKNKSGGHGVGNGGGNGGGHGRGKK